MSNANRQCLARPRCYLIAWSVATLPVVLTTVACEQSSQSESTIAANKSALINGTAYTATNTADQDPNLVGIYSEMRASSGDPRRQGYVDCSGVVVGSAGKHVLTAGHCLTDWRNYYAFKGNIYDSGDLQTSSFSQSHKLIQSEVKNDQAHVVLNPTFFQIESKRNKDAPLKPWPSDMAIMYLASGYGSGLTLNCSGLPATPPTSVRIHTASTQGMIFNDDPATLTYPYGGIRGTKTYGEFDLISLTSNPLYQSGVAQGIKAGMYVVGSGKSGEKLTHGDSGGPVYSSTDSKLLLGLVQGGYEPRRTKVGDIGWIAPFKGANCDWLTTVLGYADVVATYFDDLDGDGINDVKLLLQRTNNGADLQLIASAAVKSTVWPTTFPNATYTFPGAGSLSPTFVTAGKYVNSTFYTAMASNAGIQLYSVASGATTGTSAGTLSLPTNFSSVAGIYTLRANQDSYDDLVVMDSNNGAAVYLGGTNGLALNSTARFAATSYDSDNLVDYMAVINGSLYVSQSALGYVPANFMSTYAADVAAGQFRSDSTNGKGQFVMLTTAQTNRLQLCSYPHSNGCPSVADTKTASAMSVDDVNHDGYDDVFVTYSDRKSTWLLGGGTIGTTSASAAFTVAAVSDVNNDGLDDYTATLPGGANVFLIGTADGPAPAVWVDADGDSDQDIQFTRKDGSLAWWLKTGSTYVRGVPRSEFAVFGSKWISMNNGTVTYGPLGERVSIGAFGEYPYNRVNGEDWTSVGSGTDTFLGDIWSKNLVVLSDRASVSGDIWTSSSMISKYTNGYYCQNCSTVKVSGKVLAAPVESVNLNLSDVVYSFPTPATGVLRPTGTFAPGHYDEVVADNGNTVTFTAGKYSFNILKMEPGATVYIDSSNGPVYLLVKTYCIIRTTPKDTTGRLDKLFVGYWGTDTVSLDTGFAGTLVAPNAMVSLNSTKVPTRGSVFGDSVIMHQYNKFEHHKFADKWPGSPGF